MPQPVKLSDDLINAARDVAALSHRSLAGQIEHWAGLGRAVEGSLTVTQSTLLKRAVYTPSSETAPQRSNIGEMIANALSHAVSLEGRAEAQAHLCGLGVPLYGTDDEFPGRIVERLPDGTRRPGVLKGRTFIPDPEYTVRISAHPPNSSAAPKRRRRHR